MIIRPPLFVTTLILSASFGAHAGILSNWTEKAFQHHPDRHISAAERALGDALNRKSSKWLADAPSANVKYQTDALGSDHGYREWEGGVDLPLWWPGQRDKYKSEAKSSITLADSMIQAKRLEVAGEVRVRWWDIAQVKVEYQHAQNALQMSSKLLRDVDRKVVAGELPRSDLLLAKNVVLESKEKVSRANNRLLQRISLFTKYTGVVENITAHAETLNAQKDLNPQHPVMLLANYKVEKAQAHRNRIRGQSTGSPSLWLGAKTAKAASGFDYEDSVGVELSIPFGNSEYDAPDIAQAEQILTEASAARDRARHELEQALEVALLDYKYSEDAYNTAKEREVLAEERLALSQRAFELGETDLVRLLQAQSDANNARQNLLQTRIQADRSISMLNQALGVLPQ